ncbi:MAG: hypothetical protein D6820_00230 [Lentisphaerae bacterium]|nr:MAG: hypothetical protein D6820_00230 [Lentisphaerota bacterium]
MIVYIDVPTSDFIHISSAEGRRYFVHNKRRFLVVDRPGSAFADHVAVDAIMGWDAGTPGFVLKPGEIHSKLTIFRVVQVDRREATLLSDLLKEAPEYS